MLTAKYVYPENGTSHDKERNARHLEVGKEYKVDCVEICRCHTFVFLVGIEAIFNSVNFEFYKDGELYNIFADPDLNPYLNDNWK